MCPLWNRSNSLSSSSGITNRTGGNTEEIYSSQSTPTAPAQSSSSGSGFWNGIKNFFSNHSEGAGQVIGAGLNIGAKVADKFTGGLASPIVNVAKEGLATIGDNFQGSGFQKFTKGLTNKKISETTDKAANVFKNDKLDKVGKWKALGSLVKNYRESERKGNSLTNKPIANSSNGHVPAGYQATSSQGTTIPVKSTGKNKKKKDKNKKANKQWNEWLSKKIKKGKK